ncbi:hypothetical protein D5086_021282 [Populus alba]|uniref:Uncharacterized protein n=1 Tax=Populus alba TaxID=43335 RepID=A0ACC4BBN1_POPAL
MPGAWSNYHDWNSGGPMHQCHGFMPRAHGGQYTGNLVGKSTLAMANDEGEAKTKAMIIGHRTIVVILLLYGLSQ